MQGQLTWDWLGWWYKLLNLPFISVGPYASNMVNGLHSKVAGKHECSTFNKLKTRKQAKFKASFAGSDQGLYEVRTTFYHPPHPVFAEYFLCKWSFYLAIIIMSGWQSFPP